MRDVVIIDAVRSPMGRSKGGMFRHVRAEALGAQVVRALFQRNPTVSPKEVDDVLIGCVQQTLEQGYNVARFISLQAGLPIDVPAMTINRNCASSLSALNLAACMVMAGQGDVFVVGGVEHMGHVPMTHGIDLDPQAGRFYAKASNMMGLTAELLSRQYQVTRKMQDEFAMRSHQSAHRAGKDGWFKNEVVPCLGHDADSVLGSFTEDEGVRPDSSLEALSALRPIFDPKHGTVTAGNASAISDGASALLVMSGERARALGLKPMARVAGMGTAGVAPSVMGIGPVPAVQKALKQAGIERHQVHKMELNEAFAAQALSVLKGLDMLDGYEERVNVHGGAIALGHPLGCSGARIVTTLLHAMQRHSNDTWGVATMCIGGGQGAATVLERLH
jgi:acetyl-CoA acyltransferase